MCVKNGIKQMIDGKIGDGLVGLFKLMFWLLVFCLPLALWKLIEILIWMFDL